MTDITQRIAALPPDKQMLLLQRLREKSAGPAADTRSSQKASDEWIIRYRPNEEASLRLFCFPYAGGGASVFRPWADILPESVDVCCIQLPGRETRLGEPAYTRLTPLLEVLVNAVSPYLDRPFAFFGYSMGALISFELARQLRRVHNMQPVRLCLAAYRAPQLPNPNIKVYHLPSEVFKVILRADGVSEKILQNEELMEAILPTLRADYELCDTYRYQEEPPLEYPFSIFGGLSDIRITAADLEAWKIHNSASFKLSMLPGPHLFLHTAQDLLLAEVAEDLGVQANSSFAADPVPAESKG